MSIRDWIVNHLTPERYILQAEQAEAELAEARQLHSRAERLVTVYRRDRSQNGYAERVRAAYAGRRQ